MPNIEEIRNKITSEQFELSKHAVDQSIIRKIRLHEIRPVGKQKHDIEAISHLFLYFNPYANRKSISEII